MNGLQSQSSANPDGWGVVEYEKKSKHLISSNIDSNDQTDGLIWRDINSATYTFPDFTNLFDNVQNRISNTGQVPRTLYPHIIIGHVRKASSGTPVNIVDPHPFIFETPERDYSFVHNGGVDYNTVDGLINDVDPEWLGTHTLVSATTQYPNGVDSEHLFIYIMLMINHHNGNIIEGIQEAVHNLVAENAISNSSAINFILSDGVDLYAYKKVQDPVHDTTHTLYYFFGTTAQNKCFSAVMSQFPNPQILPGNSKAMNDDELIYISKTGNIVKFQNVSGANDNLDYVRSFHANINWSSFPVMEGNETLITPFVQPLTTNGGLHQIYYESDYQTNNYLPIPHDWEVSNQMLTNSSLYKLNFTSNTSSFTTGGFHEEGTLRSSQEPILTNIERGQEYWIGYHLLPSQNVMEAFGAVWDYVSSVSAETWYYSRQPHVGEKHLVDSNGVPIIPPAWSISNKNMEFGKGYIVRFRTDIPSFNWENPHHIDLRELCAVIPEKPEYFEFEYKPDYRAIDIMDCDDPINVLEIGAFQGEKCIGAIKPESLPCQLLVYPDWSDTTSITFEVVWKEAKSKSIISQYKVWDQDVDNFIPGSFNADVQYCQVKLGSDSGNSNNNVVPVITMQNAPNPILDNTRIMVKLSSDANFTLTIYNLKGQKVNEVFQGNRKAGKHAFLWSGKDENGKRVSSGIYFAKLNCGSQTVTNKMLVLK